MENFVQAASEIASSIRSTYASGMLAGRVALVTGGSRGIGRAIAISLGAAGSHVIVNYYPGMDAEAANVVSEIESIGGKADAIGFDVSKFDDTLAAFKKLEKDFGGVDILVNNAGIAKDNLLIKMKEEEWDLQLDVNLKGSFNCARAVGMSMMKKRWGRIVNISSVIGLMGNGGQIAYASSKAGLLGLTKSLAREMATRNVLVNAVAPGYIGSDMTAKYDENFTKALLSKIPAERMGSALDVSKLVLFFASPAADYVTGQTIAVDGGMTMM